MRGKVAKRLRRAVYGDDFSPREREYEWLRREVYGKIITIPKRVQHQLVNRGRRAAYQAMKKAVHHGR